MVLDMDSLLQKAPKSHQSPRSVGGVPGVPSRLTRRLAELEDPCDADGDHDYRSSQCGNEKHNSSRGLTVGSEEIDGRLLGVLPDEDHKGNQHDGCGYYGGPAGAQSSSAGFRRDGPRGFVLNCRRRSGSFRAVARLIGNRIVWIERGCFECLLVGSRSRRSRSSDGQRIRVYFGG
jgi:hypothetical protein